LLPAVRTGEEVFHFASMIRLSRQLRSVGRVFLLAVPERAASYGID
jgi:hypothetical protein